MASAASVSATMRGRDVPGDPARTDLTSRPRPPRRDESNEIRPANDQNSPASLTHRAPFPRKNVRPKTANPPRRYALLDKVRQKAIAFEERYRKNGKGFVRPWEVKPELKSVIDPVAHVADDEKK